VGRERGGETDDVRAVKPRDQGPQDDRPVVEEVMTLVEDDGADTRGGDAVDEGAGVRVEVFVGGRAVGGQQVRLQGLGSERRTAICSASAA